MSQRGVLISAFCTCTITEKSHANDMAMGMTVHVSVEAAGPSPKNMTYGVRWPQGKLAHPSLPRRMLAVSFNASGKDKCAK